MAHLLWTIFTTVLFLFSGLFYLFYSKEKKEAAGLQDLEMVPPRFKHKNRIFQRETTLHHFET